RPVVDRDHDSGLAMRGNLGETRRGADALVREPEQSSRGTRIERENHLLPSLRARTAVLYAPPRDRRRTAERDEVRCRTRERCERLLLHLRQRPVTSLEAAGS